MKIFRDFALISAFLTLSIYAFSQKSPGRGAWLIGGNAQLSHNLKAEDQNFFLSPAANVGYFISDHWLAGIDVFSYYSQSFVGSYNTYISLRPFARYYFGTTERQWRPFLQSGAGWTRSDFRFNNITQDATAYSANLAGGAAYFITPDLSLQGTLGYYGNYGEGRPQHDVLYGLSIQTYFSRRSEEEQAQNMPFLDKGAWQIGLIGDGGILNIGVTDDLYASIRPSAAYFLANNFALGGALTFARAQGNRILELEPFARYYFRGDNPRLMPVAEVGGGIRFQFADDREDPNFVNINFKAGAGLAWFLRPNIALEGLFYFSSFRLEDEDRFNSRFVDFQVGFQYFLQPRK